MATNIEWTDVTDNIITVKGGGWWCRKLSAGCKNCYAAKLNQTSFFGGNKLAYAGRTPELELRRDIITGWAGQRKPKKHFVASMTDIFGEWVEREWIFAFLDGMLAAPRQTFQMLTKRPAVAAREIGAWLEAHGLATLPWHMQIGTSVEDQEQADLRIPLLLSIPATVRFLSCEPLLGPLNLTNGLGLMVCPGDVDWVICGGESGPGARPMHPNWARSLRDQCAAAGVPFLFKQHGEWTPAEVSPPVLAREIKRITVRTPAAHPGPKRPEFHDWPDGFVSARVGKKAAGRLLDGCTHDEFPRVEGEVAT